MGALIFFGILIGIVLFIVGIYNGLITARNAYKNAFSQIDVQLQRRYDLIPNLVETAKGYMKHERETLEAVIAARNTAHGALKAAGANPADPGAIQKLGAAEGALGAVLTRFMALAEAYPDLKANQNMMQLTEELSSTENRIAFARQAYNDGVMSYNNKREVFPSNIVAGMFNFGAAPFLELEEPAARKAVKVSFT